MSPATKSGLKLAEGLVDRQAAMLAYLDQFRTFGVLILCGIPLVFLLKKTAGHGSSLADAGH